LGSFLKITEAAQNFGPLFSTNEFLYKFWPKNGCVGYVLGVFSNTHLVTLLSGLAQGCQMVSFHTKNPNLGKFWNALDWKMLIYFATIWNISRTFGIFQDHMVPFVFIWYIFSGFGIMYQEKSGNTGLAFAHSQRV
jgi:hypothetical protein